MFGYFWRAFWRAVGFGYFTKDRHELEKPKVLIHKSRWIAFATCGVHFLPASVSIILIGLNIEGFFIGAELQGWRDADRLKLGLLQLASKLQELLVVASMTTIIFHLLRSKLMSKDGVPLGLLSSGWSFTQLSYFWSGDFWAGFAQVRKQFNQTRKWKGLGFILMLFLSGLLAVFAGPSVAIVMIPRILDWPTGGSIFWLNGTEKQVWPELLDSNVLAGYNCSTPELQLSDPNCPSAGFSTLYQHYSHWWANWETDRVSFELLDSKTRKLAYYIASPNLTVDSWSYMAHMPTAVMQDALQDLHFKSLEYLNNLNETKLGLFRADYLLLAPTKRYEVTTKVPLVRTACGYINNGDPVNLRNMAPVDFLLPTQDSPLWKVRNGSDYETVALKVNVTTAVSSYLGIRRLMSNTSALGFPEIVVIPVEIPEIPGPEKNNTASSAGLVVARRDRSTGDWRAYKCTVDARWASATSVIQSSSESGLRRHRFVDGRVTNLVKTKLLVEDEGRMTHHEWKPPKTGSLRTIRIRPSWYQLLSPVIPSSLVSSKPNSTVTEADRSTLEALLELVVLDDHQHHPVEEGIGATHEQRKMEQIISMVFADGLSRSGATFNSNTSILLGEGAGDWKYPNWRITDKAQAQKLLRPGNPIEVFSLPNELEVEGSTNMTMRAIFNGYVMASRDWFDYMCLGVLILHTFFALSYTLYLAIHGKTSEAWDSIPELVALAQRSQPPPNDKLRNVGAGIQYYQTLKETAWVEVDESVRQAGNSGALRLRIGDVYEDRDPNLVPLPEKKYI